MEDAALQISYFPSYVISYMPAYQAWELFQIDN